MMHRFEAVQSWVWVGGLAGLIPFFAGWIGHSFLGWGLEPFLLYSAIILSFLCGQIWRQVLQGEEGQTATYSGLVIALLVPAVLWLLLFLNPLAQLLVSALGFALVYGWERRYCWSAWAPGYRVLRTVLTTLVVLTHFLVWLV